MVWTDFHQLLGAILVIVCAVLVLIAILIFRQSGLPGERISDRADPSRHVNRVACRGCDLLQRIPALPPGGKAHCGRCGEMLAMNSAHPLDRPLAIAITAAIVLVIANVSPLMSLSAVGRTATTTLIGGAIEMWMQGSKITAVIVLFCAVAAPAVYIGCTLGVLLAVQRAPAPAWAGTLMHWAERLKPWAMNEVLLLGILVALTKIAELATVTPGVGMYAVCALMLLVPWFASTFDPRAVWDRIEWASRG